MTREPKVMQDAIIDWGKPSKIETLITAIVCTFAFAVALLMFAVVLGFRWCPC